MEQPHSEDSTSGSGLNREQEAELLRRIETYERGDTVPAPAVKVFERLRALFICPASGVLFLLLGLPCLAVADAYRLFPGLDALTSEAAAVAVIEVLPEPGSPDAARPGYKPDTTGGPRDYNTVVEWVLKDDREQLRAGTTSVLALRAVDDWQSGAKAGNEPEVPENLRVGAFDITIGDRYLVFLNPAQNSRARYESLPAAGSVLRLPKELQLPAGVQGTREPVVQNIRHLIKEAGAKAGKPVPAFEMRGTGK